MYDNNSSLITQLNTLLDESIDRYIDETEYLTKADVQLLLDVVYDHIQNKKTINRDTQLIKISKIILNVKYNNNITWFDIYDIIVSPRLEYKEQNENSEHNKNIDENYDSIFERDHIQSAHTRELHNTSEQIFEFMDSEQINEITNKNDTKNDLNFNVLRYSINLKSGLIYDDVEGRDYELEIQIYNRVSELLENLSYEDQVWIHKKLENWIKLYVNTESTICEQNNNRSDIANFMNNR